MSQQPPLMGLPPRAVFNSIQGHIEKEGMENESHESLLSVWFEVILTHPEIVLDIVPIFLLNKFQKFHSDVQDNYACLLPLSTSTPQKVGFRDNKTKKRIFSYFSIQFAILCHQVKPSVPSCS